MKLKHLTIFFLLFAVLTYVVLLPVKNINATVTEAEKAEKMAELEKLADAKKAKAMEAERIAKAREADVQTFYEIFLDITQSGYGIDYDMYTTETISRLETLIAQGVNPNKSFELPSDGYGKGVVTPISHILLTCANDSYIDDAGGRNFYLEIIKLLIDSGVDWNVKNSYDDYHNAESGESTIADSLRWAERRAHKPDCLEALAYVKNHLKENNIIIE